MCMYDRSCVSVPSDLEETLFVQFAHFLNGVRLAEPKRQLLELANATGQPDRKLFVQELRRQQQRALVVRLRQETRHTCQANSVLLPSHSTVLHPDGMHQLSTAHGTEEARGHPPHGYQPAVRGESGRKIHT